MRLRAQQSCPAFSNTEYGAVAAAFSRSASAKTMLALLPPSSRVTRLTWSAHPAMICLPTAVEPVNTILRTVGLVTNLSPTTEPLPGKTWNRPSGRPASSASWPRRMLVSGVHSAGLRSTAFPAASAGAKPQAAMVIGKFHGVITPWNFPMTIAAWGFAPALAAGNAVLLKPAEWTPLTSIRLGQLALDAGLPEGLFQVLPGKGSVVGERFVTNPTVRKIVFTGSTAVGKQIMAGCADQVKRVTLELGGKSANIVFADSDLEHAAANAPGGVFDNAGQDCCARSRILVERSAYDRFMGLLEPAVHAFKVGDPGDESSDMGPLISSAHRDKVASYVPSDAPVAFRGSAPAGAGFWFVPTVLAPSRPDDPSLLEEIFGPVVSVLPF